jgi:hypothetical protein
VIHHRRALIGGTVATLLTSALIASVPATAADNHVVDQQVTDDVTQTNVKVLGDAPAVSIGELFMTTPQAVALAHEANAMPQAVRYAMTVDEDDIQMILGGDGSPFDQRRIIEEHLDAIHERLDQCGSTCIMNIQMHGVALAGSDDGTVVDELTAWIIKEENERLAADEFAMISFVGDGDTGPVRYRTLLTTPTSIDFLVQDVGPDMHDDMMDMS